MELIGDARVLACPSVFDSAPGVLFEAAVLEANVVASRNCGNWSVCHPALVASPPDTENFVAAIRMAMERPYPNRLDVYLGENSLDELLKALAAPHLRASASVEL